MITHICSNLTLCCGIALTALCALLYLFLSSAAIEVESRGRNKFLSPHACNPESIPEWYSKMTVPVTSLLQKLKPGHLVVSRPVAYSPCFCLYPIPQPSSTCVTLPRNSCTCTLPSRDYPQLHSQNHKPLKYNSFSMAIISHQMMFVTHVRIERRPIWFM